MFSFHFCELFEMPSYNTHKMTPKVERTQIGYGSHPKQMTWQFILWVFFCILSTLDLRAEGARRVEVSTNQGSPFQNNNKLNQTKFSFPKPKDEVTDNLDKSHYTQPDIINNNRRQKPTNTWVHPPQSKGQERILNFNFLQAHNSPKNNDAREASCETPSDPWMLVKNIWTIWTSTWQLQGALPSTGWRQWMPDNEPGRGGLTERPSPCRSCLGRSNELALPLRPGRSQGKPELPSLIRGNGEHQHERRRPEWGT